MSIAIITGASSGMGKEFVQRLDSYKLFDEVYVIARRKEILDSLQEYTKAKVISLPLDLTKKESFDIYKKFLEEKKPSVELLINCAGFGLFDDFINCDIEKNYDMVQLNCNALQMITYLTIPYMIKDSKIVQMASMSSFQSVPYINLYSATKAFVLSFSRSLNVELRNKFIHVMALCPFWVKTNFFEIANKKNKIKYFDVLYTPDFIIRKCFKALNKKHVSDVCIPGMYAKFQCLLVKILPNKLVMKIWLKKEKIK